MPEELPVYVPPASSAGASDGGVPPVPPAPPQGFPLDYGHAPSPESAPQENAYQNESPSQPYYGSSAPQTAYPSDQPYGGAQQGYGQQPHVYQQPYRAQGYPRIKESAVQSASNSMVMGIIAACAAVLIGWIPILGLLGVAAGVGLGIPAIFQAKNAESNGAGGTNSKTGKVFGWVAIGFSIFWVLIYVLLMLIGAAVDDGTTSASMM